MFHHELQALKQLPHTEVHLHPHFIEIPFLLQVFQQLVQHPIYAQFRYVFLSRQHDPAAVQTPWAQDTVLIYTSNEDGYLPPCSQMAGYTFTPDCAQWPLPPHVYAIPLGCNANTPEAPWRPWEQRSCDVFFSGQVLPRRSGFIMQAIQMLYEFQGSPWQAQINLTPAFQSGLKANDYARYLMNSRLALVPAGISPITLRLFEALRSGCVPIYNALPPYWFFQELPGIQLSADWQGLSETVQQALNQPQRLHIWHKQSRAHYLRYCSADATAEYMAAVLISTER